MGSGSGGFFGDFYHYIKSCYLFILNKIMKKLRIFILPFNAAMAGLFRA